MYRKKQVIHIVAAGVNGEIGKENRLLWHIPEELKYFRNTTLGHVLLMGKNTINSLPNPLKRRVVLEVSINSAYNFSLPFSDYPKKEEALRIILGVAHTRSQDLNTNEIFIGGGEKLYKSTECMVDAVYLTRVHKSFKDADAFYNMPDGFIFSGYTQKSIDCVLDGETVLVTFEKWVKGT